MEWGMLLLGFLIGSLVTVLIVLAKPTAGTLKIDHSNPEKDVYRFEIDDLDKLNMKRRIALKIDHNANLSQK